MEGGDGRVYKETVYRPKDHKERALRKRRMIMIAVVIVLLIIIIALIIGVSVHKSKGNSEKALVLYPQTDGHPITFRQGDRNSFKSYTDALQAVLDGYSDENQRKEEHMDCSNLDEVPANTNAACVFRVADLGDECTADKDFGFMEGQPCFLLQFNPPKDWKPELFTNVTYPKYLPDIAQSIKTVPVYCKASMDEMVDSIGPIKTYPPGGFPAVFFPYTSQSDYKAPLMMVKMMKPTNGVVNMVTCKVYDPSIDEEDSTFIADFTFQVD